MKASHSLRDTMSSGIHSWSSQAEGQSCSWNNLLSRSRHTDTPSCFNGGSAPPAGRKGQKALPHCLD